jgi:putative ABC transport system permease protein
MLLTKLVISNFATRRVRTVLTLAAVALAVSLVVAVTTGYSSVEGAIYKYLATYMGATDAQIENGADWHKGIPESLVGQIRQDPDVAHVIGRFETDTGLLDKDGKYVTGPAAELIGVDRPTDDDIIRTPINSGAWFDTPSGDVAVIDQRCAERLKLSVGESFIVPGPAGKRTVKVVGICQKPAFFADRVQSIYMPIRTAQELTQHPGVVTDIMIRLRSAKLDQQFGKRWEPKLQSISPDLKLKLARDTRKDMERQLEGVRFLSKLGGAVALLSAAFIVMSTLSMGVAERQRTLAMMRAIGAFRGQIVRMVLIEGAFLGLAGAVLGVPLGIAWAWILAQIKSDYFTAGVIVDWSGVLMGVIGSLAAAMIAGTIPAWNASRVSPLEAMTPLARSSRMTWRGQILLGIVATLLALTDTMTLSSPVSKEVKLFGHFFLGLPALMLGFFLLSPIAVLAIEGLVVGSSEWALKFLDHVARGRTVVRTVIGVAAVLVSILLCRQVWHWFFELPKTGAVVHWAMVLALLAGLFLLGCHITGWVLLPLVGGQQRLLRNQLSGAVWRAAGTCAALMLGLAILISMQTVGHSMLEGWKLPTRFPDIFIWTTNQQLDDKQWGQLSEIKGIRNGEVMPMVIGTPGLPEGFWSIVGSALIPDTTMFVGVDPDMALDMMELDFRDGNAADAKAGLKKGGQVIVTEEFRVLKGLKVGDKLPLMTKKGLRDFTICGVVWSPGIDVMVSMFDLRGSIEQRTAMTVFGSLKDAKSEFGWDKAFLFAANLEMGLDKEILLKQVRDQLGEKGWKAGDVRKIKADIISGFEKLLMLLTTVAFAAMAVAALGVTNTVMASVRSRQWQFGILRSIGVTRGQLLRLVLAEALLLGVIGSAMGLAAGFLMSINGMSLSEYIIGYVPKLSPPWGPIGLGMGVTLGISLLASIWPASYVARTEPLTLLQSGRAAI